MPGDGHDRCLSCLGVKHAEVAFVDESCFHCGKMTVAEFRTRLCLVQAGGVPVPLPRPRLPHGGSQGGATLGSSRAGLTVTEIPLRKSPLVSFGATPDDRMSIAASEGESDLSGDDDVAQLPPSGQSTVPDSEMVAMLARATERVGLEWRPPPRPEPSRLDDWFIGVARAGSQGPTPVSFFSEVHDELLELGWHLSLTETAVS